MKSVTSNVRSTFRTLMDALERVGHVPTDRILLNDTQGSATETDLLDNSITEGWPVELVDGILVRKAIGWSKALISAALGFEITRFVCDNNLGIVSGPKGPIRLRSGLIRMPDVSFIRWDSVDDPDRIENPPGAFLEYSPDLAVEVLSASNSRREMEIKLGEYAKAGVRLVWYVDPRRKEVVVYPKGNPRKQKVIGIEGTLDGGDVLPGFALPVARVFEKRAPAKKGKGKK